MSDIDRALDIVLNDIRLAELGLRVKDLTGLRSRLAALRCQKWAQFSDGLEAEIALELGYKPKRRPETCLVPMGYDQYLDSHGVVREQDCDVRPDL